MQKEIISTREALRLTDWCYRTLHTRIESGALPVYKVGNRFFFKRADVLKLVEPVPVQR